ncbi:hypothetical protein M2171_002438 [Bradyrhizobium japonicum USDA 38]|nr:hypothetical protein [Bradyrhizobium japonicum USDA 38]MCS3945819.1 hypothetical protein [Bradyrhizobium japonicum]
MPAKDSSRPQSPDFRAWLLARVEEDRAESAPPTAEQPAEGER